MYELLKKYNIQTVYHFTEQANLKSIKEQRGIFSLKLLKEKCISDISYISNNWSQDADRYKNLDSYVHLCFVKGQHPMAYHAILQDKSIIWLEIDISILNKTGVLYTNDVSNKAGVKLLDETKARTDLDIEAINSFLPFDKPNNKNRKIATYKYEILIPDCVPLNYIRNI